MNKINLTLPQTNIEKLDQVAKDYLELRRHEFTNIVEKMSKEESYFYNEFKFHQYNNLSSLNLIIHSSLNSIEKEYVSFHYLNDTLVTIDDLFVIDDNLKKIITSSLNNPSIAINFNNFYLTEAGLNFIYLDENREKELFIANEFLIPKLYHN